MVPPVPYITYKQTLEPFLSRTERVTLKETSETDERQHGLQGIPSVIKIATNLYYDAQSAANRKNLPNNTYRKLPASFSLLKVSPMMYLPKQRPLFISLTYIIDQFKSQV